MSQIESIKVGGENGVVYNLNADALTTPRAINGVEFDGESDISNFATCSTAASTAAKTVSIAGFLLSAGAMVRVKFTAGNTATTPTLNVNSTGAKAIVEYGSTAAGSAAWAAGEVVDFCYDGTSWCMVSGATGTDTVRGKVIVDAEPTSGSTNAVQSGATADMINSLTEAAYITQSTTGSTYTRATMTSTNETGYAIAVDDAADNVPLKDLTVGGNIGSTATRLSVTGEAETVLANQLVRFGTPYWTNVSGQATISVSGTDTMVMTKTANTAQASDYSFRMGQTAPWRLGHKYFVSATIMPDKLTTMFFGNHDHKRATFSSLPAGVATPVSEVFTLPSTETDVTYMIWMVNQSAGYTQGEKILLKDIMLIDLTVMFGPGNEPETPEAFLEAFPNAASYIDTDRTGTKMSRAYGQTQYGDYIGQTYTIDIPAEAIPGSGEKQFTWRPVAGTLVVQSAGSFDVPAKSVTSYLGNTRIYCADGTGVTYNAGSAVYRLDPTIAYENLRNAIVSLGGNV